MNHKDASERPLTNFVTGVGGTAGEQDDAHSSVFSYPPRVNLNPSSAYATVLPLLDFGDNWNME